MPLGKALHERFFGPLGLDATWYQASEKPRARTAHGYRFAGTSRTAPRDRPLGRDGDRAVHLGRHRRRRRGIDRDDLGGRGDVGPAAVLRPGPRPGR